MSNSERSFVLYSNEVVIALSQTTGTDLNSIKDRIVEAGGKLSTAVEVINLTDLIQQIDFNKDHFAVFNNDLNNLNSKDTAASSGFKKLSEKMHIGTLLRKNFGQDIFGVYGMIRLAASREAWHKRIEEGAADAPKKKIYLLDSLKHPDEVDLLREVYGKAFWLIGVSAEKKKRAEYLQTFRGMSPSEAASLISRDEDEQLDYGQKTADAYEKADFFFNESSEQDDLDRFLNIVFGNSKIAPYRDEQLMHMAASIAAQSSDLSRQVGAVLVSPRGEVLAIGCNDVPKFPGGQYKEGDEPDYRDVTLGHDPNHRRRDEILDRISTQDSFVKGMIKNLIEYHRAVHAEMETLISCARKGISTVDATLYATTYPCHNCAKHLLNAGVKKIVYIQAYAKSLATELHGDAIIEGAIESESKMILQKYVGIGPRKYIDHFSLTLSETSFGRKGVGVDKGWKTSVFNSISANPRFPVQIIAVTEAEKNAMKHVLKIDILDSSKEAFVAASRLAA
jgi:deoxycytidylate deaminase